MRIGSLFSGYGGLDRGVQAVLGGSVAWHCEIEPAPSRILAHHHPDVPNLGDITKVDWAAVEPVDVLTGGFPCTDVSHAGLRLGLGPKTRSGLWAEMGRAISILRPRLVVIENVRGLLSAKAERSPDAEPVDLNAITWETSSAEAEPDGDDLGPEDGNLGQDDGAGPVLLRALGAVLGDLADLGYDAWWTTVRAADAGAPHGRARVFVFAWPARDAEGVGVEGQRSGRVEVIPDVAGAGLPLRPGVEPAPDTTSDGRDERRTEPAGQLGGPHAPERSAPAYRHLRRGTAKPRRKRGGPAALRGTERPVSRSGICGSWSSRHSSPLRMPRLGAVRPHRPQVGARPRTGRPSPHRTERERHAPAQRPRRRVDDGPPRRVGHGRARHQPERPAQSVGERRRQSAMLAGPIYVSRLVRVREPGGGMTKECETCGSLLVPRYREGAAMFAGRRYCSRPCAAKRDQRKEVLSPKTLYRKIRVGGRAYLEHRYIMEQELGRPLLPTEHVHHKDHNRLNNDPSNLEVVTVAEHAKRHTWRPVTKACVICGGEFTPHKTKRARQQTCGPACKSRLLSIRNAERRAPA